jgi:hypothetical protein
LLALQVEFSEDTSYGDSERTSGVLHRLTRLFKRRASAADSHSSAAPSTWAPSETGSDRGDDACNDIDNNVSGCTVNAGATPGHRRSSSTRSVAKAIRTVAPAASGMSKTAALYLVGFVVWNVLTFVLPLKARLEDPTNIKMPLYTKWFRKVRATMTYFTTLLRVSISDFVVHH